MDGLLRRLLSGPDGGFPRGYAVCFLIGFVLMTVSVLPFGVIREPLGKPRAEDDPHTGHYGRDSLRVWRTNTGFRRFLYGQIALTLSALAVPFYVLYAERHLRAGTDAVAGYTAALVLVASFGSLGWGAWSDRAGNKIVLLAVLRLRRAGVRVRAARAVVPAVFRRLRLCWRWRRRAGTSPATTS